MPDALPVPLVSVIVRSMGRPELAAALQSIARQDHPRVEIIVVDATGGTHPALPSLALQPGHRIRLVGGDGRLTRPHAANVGLLAAGGEWLCFLDDDDTYDPDFISALLRASAAHTDALVIYGRARMLNAAGEAEREFGAPFNRSLMHYGPLFYWQASLIRRRVVGLGCRFDGAFDVCEDRDFLAQIAEHGEFAFVPVVGFNYCPHLGTSGTAGANRSEAKLLRFDGLLRAKWAGTGTYHAWRATRMCQRAIAAWHSGERDAARERFFELLRAYPDDPNALNGLARVLQSDGDLARAEATIARALEVNPNAAEYRLTRALILDGLGKRDEASFEASVARNDPLVRPQAEALLARLGPPPAALHPTNARGAGASPTASRLAPCPCGSGRRYKHCCGRKTAPAAPPSAVDQVLRDACARYERGDAEQAKRMLDALAPAQVGDAMLARAAAEICVEFAAIEQAYAFLERSSQLEYSLQTGRLLARCCDLLWRDRARASAFAMAQQLRNRIERRTASSRRANPGPIHVLSAPEAGGCAAQHAIRLHRLLGPHADVHVWTTAAANGASAADPPIAVIRPQAAHYPNGGTLFVVGHEIDAGDWWEAAEFERVVFWLTHDLPDELVQRMAQLEEARRIRKVEFVFASRFYRDLTGVPGIVGYPLVEPLAAPRASAGTSAGLRIGVLAAESARHHPNAMAMLQRIRAAGHGVELLDRRDAHARAAGGQDHHRARTAEWRDVGAFADRMDCLVYRNSPLHVAACGWEVLTALARAVPVVVFRDDRAAAELVVDGTSGFVVDSEDEALACLNRLGTDLRLRREVGEAARRQAAELVRREEAMLLEHCVGATVG